MHNHNTTTDFTTFNDEVQHATSKSGRTIAPRITVWSVQSAQVTGNRGSGRNMDYLDPAAPTCPHLHPHLYTYTHTHTHPYTRTHLNTLLACEPQVTTMYTNSKEAAWSDNVSKQLQYD